VSESKHTGGPWHILSGPNGGYEVGHEVTAVGKIVVASVPPVHGNRQYANARLIAAGPELLVACRSLVHQIRKFKYGTPAGNALFPDTMTGTELELIQRDADWAQGVIAKATGITP